MKGEYDGEESYGEGHSFGEVGSILRRSLILVDFGESEARGTSLLGVLGTGARISLWYPRARELDMLLLVATEEKTILGSV